MSDRDAKKTGKRSRITGSHQEGRKRIIIEGVEPEIEYGRFAIKRTVGEKVRVEADVFTDGHDAIAGYLLFRHEAEKVWTEVPLAPLINDRWHAEFGITKLGCYRYTIEAWVDAYATWRRDLLSRVEANVDSAVDFAIGARLLEEAAERVPEGIREKLRDYAAVLSRSEASRDAKRAAALDPEAERIMLLHPDRRNSATYCRELRVTADREIARFGAWYEMFPRSTASRRGAHGTLDDCIRLLPYVASMGFDVLYLPPIHPIGITNRKGKNNRIEAAPEDEGSPWAIGAVEGGHKAIHPRLGTLEDFRRLAAKAKDYNMEIALDIAFQCSPDHPYVGEHPEWFRWRPDGTLQYAENPPKKYQDIYPFEFECNAWEELWEELKSVFLFWIEQGVRIFRVDNPHTKPFRFWEWVIDEIKKLYPETIFLSEAFTRPKVMYRLAKLGFTQSYTYFAWRNTRYELTEYFRDISRPEILNFFHPNLWPNTPDILTEYLQFGGRPAFMVRAVLAATLAANYGIYGPAFELCENVPREPGSEEYINSEKYEIRSWERERPDSLSELLGRLNRIRRANKALQTDGNIHFQPVDNEQILCYSRQTPDLVNVILVVVNLDPHNRQWGWVDLDLDSLGIPSDQTFQVHDLLSEARYLWRGSRNYVELNPQVMPAHVFLLRRRVRTEQQFDYYM